MNMKYKHTAITLLASAAITVNAHAQSASPDAWERFDDWNNGWNINDVLFSSMHLHGVGGFSSTDPNDLALGGHDPRRQAFSAQAIEPAVSVRTEYFEAFANYLMFQEADGGWEHELEEAFGKILLPGGFEIRGGQFLSRFGVVNNRHIHAWDFVDAEMPVSRFLGEEGLILRGVEASWELPLRFDPGLTAVATLGFGKARSHDHDHGGHDDHDDEHGDEHGDEHDDEHDDHGHGGGLFDGDEAYLSRDILTARLMARYRFSDFHTVTAGISYAGGDNGFGRTTRLIGLDAEYLWRENGLEPGGRAFRWTNELVWRRVSAFEEAHHDEDHDDDHGDDHGDDHEGDMRGNYTEFGFYSTAVYTWNSRFDTSLRVSWLEGVDDLGLDERLRISPAISWWLDDSRRIGMRTQYNYDRFGGGRDEHTLWLQMNIALGSTVEVR